ncbi:hypothetical protein, partial [Klebsiella pneumoniae]|uniref:hypothetical protein n=1 Tax=Klebsiella pneumoniae TaxID=573 RepID=UPI0040557DC0
RANIILKIGNITNSLNTYVVKNNQFSYDLLLGLDAITKFKLIQDDKLNILQKIDKDRTIKLEDIEMKPNTSLNEEIIHEKENKLNEDFRIELT